MAGLTPAPGRLRSARYAVVLPAVSGLLVLALAALPSGTEAVFSATTGSTSSYAAATPFPDYPTAVIADHPLFYHRLDDAARSLTAADSSGTGVLPGGPASPTSVTNASWLVPFDDGAGSTARDLSGQTTTHDVTLTNVTWATGYAGSSASFNGSTSYADTASSVVTTSTYFTVSIWVYLNSKAATMTAISQVDSANSAFRLGYNTASDRFTFSMTQSNAAAATVDSVASTSSPSLNTWYLLSGVYESTSGGRLNLYVNGTSQATTAHTTTWNATGVLEIGAAQTNGVRGEWWNGRVDEGRVNGSLSSANVASLYQGSTSGPTSSWPFSENTGTSTADISGGTDTGTFGSGASWTTGKSGTGVALDGTSNGYVDGRIAAVDTSLSFTVVGWVYLTDAGNTVAHTAFSQGGSTGAGFAVKYTTNSGGRWDFVMSQAESNTPTYDDAYSATAPARNTWVLLIAIYDASATQLRLYVNGTVGTNATHTNLWNATATHFQGGRQRSAGGWADPWQGSLDDLRTYPRVLNTSEIAKLYNGGSGTGSNFGNAALGAVGALQGSQQGQQASTAEAFSGTSAANGYNPTRYTNPTTFSLECWFRTVGPGGTLMSFGSSASGNSSTYDRRVFVNSSGYVIFGANSGTANIITSPSTYFDGAWHHLVATLSPSTGMQLYLDGTLSGTLNYSTVANYNGVWRWGGETHNGSWPSPDYITATIDEVAVYNTVLSAQQVAEHYHANH